MYKGGLCMLHVGTALLWDLDMYRLYLAFTGSSAQWIPRDSCIHIKWYRVPLIDTAS